MYELSLFRSNDSLNIPCDQQVILQYFTSFDFMCYVFQTKLEKNIFLVLEFEGISAFSFWVFKIDVFKSMSFFKK